MPLRRPLAVAAGAAFLALAVLWAAPASLRPWERLPDYGDPLHLAYVMAWGARQVVRAPLRYLDSNSFHPYPASLAFGDHLLPQALFAAPVFWATGNAVLAANVALLAALSLSALSMALLLRQLTGSGGAGFVAGVAYAFNTFTQHEVLRVHVVSLQWWPLALLATWRFASGPGTWKCALAIAGFLTLQGLSSSYYLVYGALLAPLWLAGAFGLTRRRPSWSDALRLAVAGGLAALASAPILLPYVARFRALHIEHRLVDGLDLLAFLSPAPGSLWWGAWPLRLETGRGGEHFVGLVTLALAGVGLVALRRGRVSRFGWIGLLTALLGLVLSLGPNVRVGGHELLPGPYRLLYALPLARGMASSARLGALVVLGVAILAGLGAAVLLARLAPGRRAAGAAAVAGLLVAEHWSPPLPAAELPTGARVPAAYRFLAEEGEGPVVELPLHGSRERRYFATYPYFSTYHWRPIPFGRTSFPPPAHEALVHAVRDFPEPASLHVLDGLGIRSVVVHPRLWWDAAERRSRLRAIERSPRLALVRAFSDAPEARFEDLGLGEERVLRLDPGPRAAAPCRPGRELPRGAVRVASSGDVPATWLQDGDLSTAWRGGRRSAQTLEAELAQPQPLAAISIPVPYPWLQFPRELRLFAVSDAGVAPVPVDDSGPARLGFVRDLLERPRQASLVLRFPAQTFTRLRLWVAAADEAGPAWSIPELRFHGVCE